MRRMSRIFLPLGVALSLPCVGYASEERETRFFWQPSVRVGVEVNDNAMLDRGDERDDTSVRVRPQLELGYQSASVDVGADLGVDFRRHTQDGKLNDVFYRMRGHAEAGLLSGLTLRVEDDYVPTAVELGVPDDYVGNLVQTNRAVAKLRYWLALGDRNELTLGVPGARLDAESVATLVPGPGGAATPGRFHGDHWEGGGFIQVARNLGDRGQLFVRGRGPHRSFEKIDDATHTDFSGVVGVDLRGKGGLTLRLEGGGGLTDFEGGSSRTRFDGRADLGYRVARWRFGLGVQRGLASDLVGNAFENLTGRLVVERSFGSRTRMRLMGFGSLRDAASQAAEGDGFGGAEFRIRRQLSREFSLDASYRFWENAGSRSSNDFRQHRGYFELRYLD